MLNLFINGNKIGWDADEEIVGYSQKRLTFCIDSSSEAGSKWSDLSITVIFKNGTNLYYTADVISGQSYLVPWEVLRGDSFFVSAFGVKNDDVRATTTEIEIHVKRSGFCPDGSPDVPADPTSSVYEQISAELLETRTLAEAKASESSVYAVSAANSASDSAASADSAEVAKALSLSYSGSAQIYRNEAQGFSQSAQQSSASAVSAEGSASVKAAEAAESASAAYSYALSAENKAQEAAAAATAVSGYANAEASRASAEESRAAAEIQREEVIDSFSNDFSGVKLYVGYNVPEDVYGVEVDFVNKTFTRLAGAAGKTAGANFDSISCFGGRQRCMMFHTGEICMRYGSDPYYSDSGAIPSDQERDGIIYNAANPLMIMVEQPKFYYRVVPIKLQKIVGGQGYHLLKAQYYVSTTSKDGFKLHPAFIKNGVERDKIYLSAFEGSVYDVSAGAILAQDEQVADFTIGTGDKLSSVSDVKPASGLTQQLTRRNCGILAENRGAGWSQQYAATISCSQLLFLIEYASFNSQTAIGNGITNKAIGTGNESEITGVTSSLGNSSGSVTNSNGYNVVSYRGEENIWGNIYKFTDGMNIYCDSANGVHDVYIADRNFTENKNDGQYTNAGITIAKANGYVSVFGYNEDFDWLFIPSAVLGNSSLPVGDSLYQASSSDGYKIAFLGGSWNAGGGAGAFSWTVLNASSVRDRSLGGRLVFVPPVV